MIDIHYRILNICKTIITIAFTIGIIGILLNLCSKCYKNEISIDSLFTLILAFFSILISCLFYLKSTEQINKFNLHTLEQFNKLYSVLGRMDGRIININEKLDSAINYKNHEKKLVVSELNVYDENPEIIETKPEVKQRYAFLMETIKKIEEDLKNLDTMKKLDTTKEFILNQNTTDKNHEFYEKVKKENLKIENENITYIPLKLLFEGIDLDLLNHDGALTEKGKMLFAQQIDSN